MSRPLCRVLILMFLGLALTAGGWGQSNSFVWNGGSSTWSTPGNWTVTGTGSSTYPGQNEAGDTVTIGSGTVTMDVTPLNSLGGLSNNGTVDIAGNTLVVGSGSVSGTGTIEDSVGTGTFDASALATITMGSLGVNGGTALNIYLPATTSTNLSGDWNVTSYTPGADTINFTGGATENVTSNGNSFNSVTINKSGGGLTFTDVSTIATLAATSGAYSLTFFAATTVTNAAVLAMTGGLTLTGTTAATYNFKGGLTATGSTLTTGGTGTKTLESVKNDISTGPVFLQTALTINTDTTYTTGGNISINGTVTTSTAVNLYLYSVTKNATVTGNVSGIATLRPARSALGSTGTTTFQGSVSATSITTYAQAFGLKFQGGVSLTSAASFLNTGALQIGASGTTSTFTAGVTATAPSSVSLGGTISSTNAALNFADTHGVTLNADTTLSSGSAATTLGGVVGGGGYSLTLNGMSATSKFGSTVSGLNNLTVATGTTFSLGGNATLTGTLTVNSSSTLAVGGSTLSFGVYSGDGTDVLTTTSGTLTATGNGGTVKTLTVTTGVTLNGGSGTTGIVVTNPVTGALTTTGKVSLNGTSITTVANTGTLTLNGALTASGTVTNTNGTINTGSWALSFAGYTGGTGDTVISSSGTLTATGNGGTVGTLTVTTGVTVNGGSGTTGIVVTNPVTGVLTTTGKVSLNGTTVTTVANTGTLTLNGALTASGTVTNTGGTINTGGSTLSFAGYTGGTGDTVTSSSGGVTNTGASAATVGTLTVTTGVTLAGGTGGLTVSTSNITTSQALTTSGTVSFPGGDTFGTLTVSSGTLTLGAGASTATGVTVTSGNLMLGGNLTGIGTLSNSGTLTAGGYTLGFGTYTGNGSDIVASTSGTVTATGTGGTIGTLTVTTGVTLNGGTTSLTVTNPVTGSVSVTVPSGTVSLGGTLGAVAVTGGTLNLNSGATASTFSLGTGAFSNGASTFGVTGTFSQSSGTTLTQGTGGITLGGTSVTFAGTFTKNLSGLITFNGGTGQALAASGQNLGNVTVTGGSTVVTLAGESVTFDNLTTSFGGTLTLDATSGNAAVLVDSGKAFSNGGAFTVAGTNAHTATLAGSGGTATFSGNDIGWSSSQPLTLTSILYGPAMSLGSGTVILGDGNCTFNAVTVGTGTFNAGGNSWSIAGNWDNSSSGTLSNTAGTVTFTGTGTTVNTGGTSAGKTFGPVTVSGTVSLSGSSAQFGSLAGTGTLTANSQALTVTGNVAVANLTASGSETITVGGNFQPATAFTSASSTVVLTGTGVTLKPAGNFFNLTVNGTVTNLLGDLTTTGSIVIGAAGGLTAGANTITVGQNWTNNHGASGFTAGTSTVQLDPNQSSHTVTGSTSFYSFKVDAWAAPAQVTVNFPAYSGVPQTTVSSSGTLTLKGSNSYLLVLTGSSNWALGVDGGTTQVVQLVQVTYGNALGANITASSSSNQANNNQAGTGSNWIFSPSTLTWTGASGTSWTTPGNWNLGVNPGFVPNPTDSAIIPSGTTHSLDLGGLSATIASLSVTGGTVNASSSGSVTVTGTLSVSSGVSIPSPTNTTWILTGAPGTVNSALGTSIGNLTVNSTGTVALSTNPLAVSNLTITAGTLSTGNLALTVNGTTTATAAASILDASGMTSANLTLSGTVSGSGQIKASQATTEIDGDLTVTTFTPDNGTVAFKGSSTQSVGSYTFYTLQINNSADTVTSTGAWTVTNGLTLTAGTWNPGAFIHLVAGNWDDHLVTFQPTTGTIQLTSSNPNVTQGVSNYFQGLTLNDGATLKSNIATLGVFALNHSATGVFTDGGFTVTASGNVTFGASTSSVMTGGFVFLGTTSLTTNNANNVYHNLAVGNGTTAGSLTFADNPYQTGAFTVGSTAGSIVSAAGRTWTLVGGASVNLTNLVSAHWSAPTTLAATGASGTSTVTSAGLSWNAVTSTMTGGGLTFADAVSLASFTDTTATAYTVAFNAGGTVSAATTFETTAGSTLTMAGPLAFPLGASKTGGTVNVSGTVSSSSAALNFGATSVVLNANTVITTTTTGSGAAITLGPVTDGTSAYTLGITAGTAGNVILGTLGAAGTSALGAVTVNSANSVNFNGAVYTASLTQTAGNGTTTVGANITTSGAVSLTANALSLGAYTVDSHAGPGAVDFYGNTTLTGAFAVISTGATTTFHSAVTGSSTLTVTAGAFTSVSTVTTTGTITLNVDGQVSIGNTLSATGGNIAILPVTATTISLGNGTTGMYLTSPSLGFLSASGSIQIGSATTAYPGGIGIGGGAGISIGSNLVVQSSGANVQFGFTGAGYSLTLAAAKNLTFNIGTGSITSNGTATGDITLQGTGTLYLTSAANVWQGAGPVAWNVSVPYLGSSTLTGALDLNDTVALTVSGAVSTGSTLDITGATTLNVASPTVALTTSGANLTLHSPVTLKANTLVTTGAVGTGTLTFSSTVQGTAGTETLGVTVGTGQVTFNGAVGTVTNLGNLTVTAAAAGAPVTFAGAVTLKAGGILTLTNAGNTLVEGTVTAPGGFADATGVGTFNNTGGTISTTNTALSIVTTGAITVGAALSSGNGNTTVKSTGSTVGIGATLASTTGTIAIDSAAGNLTTVSSGANITTTTGPVTFGGTLTGTLSTAGNITTAGGPITWTRSAVLAGNVILDATNSGGTTAGAVISLAAVNDNTGNTDNLTVKSSTTGATGTLTLNGTIGSSAAVEPKNLSLTTATALALPTIQVGGTLTIVSGALTQSALKTLTIGGATSLTGSSTITLANTGNGFTGTVSVPSVTNLNLGATVANLTMGAVSASGTTTLGSTTNELILTGAVSSGGAVVLTGDTMSLSGGTVSAGPNPVTLAPSTTTRATNLGTDGGALNLAAADLNPVTTTGLLTLGGAGISGAITVSGAPVTATAATGGITVQNTTGGIDVRANLTSANALTLTTTGAITRSTGAGTLTSASGLLTLTAVSGVGVIGTNPVVVDPQGTFTASNTSSGDLFVQTVGSVTLNGSFSLTECSGGNLRIDTGTTAGKNLIIAGNISVAGAGTVSLNATGTITRSGNFTVTANTVNLGTTAATSVGASGTPIQTAATTLLDAVSSAGDIWVSNTGNVNAEASATGGVVNLANTGSFTSAGALASSASTVTLSSTGAMTLANDVTGPTGVTLSVTTANTLFTHSGGTISANSGSTVAVTSDEVALSGGTIGAAGDIVSLVPLTLSNTISFGVVSSPGILGLTTAELSTITGKLLVGSSSLTGPIIANTAATLPATADPVHLYSQNSITGTATLAAYNLAVSVSVNSGSTVNLVTAVNQVAVVTVGGSVTLADTNSGAVSTTGTLVLGAVDGVTGISSLNGAVAVTEAGGHLTVSNAVNAGASTAVLTDSSGTSKILTVGATTVSATGGVTLVADQMNLAAASAGAVSSGASDLVVHQSTNTTLLNLGTASSTGTLGLTNTSLNVFATTGYLRLGNANTGAVTVSAAVTPADAVNVVLTTGAGVSGAGNTLTASKLKVVAVGAVTLATAVSTLSGTLANGGAVNTQILNALAGGLTIGTVDGTSGYVTSGTTSGSVDIEESLGTLTVTQNVWAATNGAITLKTTGGTKNIGYTGGTVGTATSTGLLTLSATGAVAASGAALSTDMAFIDATSGAGDIWVTQAHSAQLGSATGVTATGGVVNIVVSGNITMGKAVSTAGSGTSITLTATGTIAVSQSISAANNAQITLVPGAGQAITWSAGTVGATGSSSILLLDTTGQVGTAGSPLQVDVGTVETATSAASSTEVTTTGLYLNALHSLGLGNGTNGVWTSGVLQVTAVGGISQGTRLVKAASLNGSAGSDVILTTAGNVIPTLNAFTTLSGSGTATFQLTTSGALNVAQALATTSAATFSDNVTLTAPTGITLNSNITVHTSGTVTFNTATSGGVTQSAGVISANALQLNGAGTFTLNDGNGLANLGATTTGGPVKVTSTTSLAVGTVNVSATQNLTLTAPGLTETGAITAQGLELLGALTSNVALTSTTNSFANLAGNLTVGSGTNTVSISDNAALKVTTVNTVGLTTAGQNLTLLSTGALTQDQAVNVGTGTLTAVTELTAGANLTLNLAAGNTARSVALQTLDSSGGNTNTAGNIVYTSDGTQGLHVLALTTGITSGTATLTMVAASAQTVDQTGAGSTFALGSAPVTVGSAGSVSLTLNTHNVDFQTNGTHNVLTSVTLVSAGMVSLDAAGGYSLSGTASGNVDATTFSGSLTIPVGKILATTGNATQNLHPAGSLQVDGQLTTVNGQVTCDAAMTNNLAYAGTVLAASGTGAVMFSTPVVLQANTTITTTNQNITFVGTVNAAAANTQTLTLTAGAGAVSFGGTVGATALGGLTVTSSGSLTSSSTIAVSGAGSALTLGCDGAVSLGGTTSNAAGDILVEPVSGGTAVNVDNSGGLAINYTSFHFLNASGTVFLGRINGTGAVTVGAGNPLSLAGGNLQIQGSTSPVTFAFGAGTTLTVPNLTIVTGGAVTHGGSATNDVTVAGPGILVLTGVSSVGTAGVAWPVSVSNLGLSTVSGLVNLTDSTSLTVVGSLTSASGPITLATTSGSNLTLSAPVSSGSGDQTYSPAGTLYLNYSPSAVVVQTAGNVTFTGPVVLEADAAITENTGSGSNTINFASTVDSAASTSHALTVTGAADNVTFAGALGTSVPLNTLTVTSSSTVSVANIGTAWNAPGISTTLAVTTTGTGTVAFTGTVYATGGNQSWIVASGKALTASAGASAIWSTPGLLTINGNFTSTSYAATLISNTIALGSYGTWNLTGQTLNFYTYTPSTPMNWGFTSGNWDLTATQLGRLQVGAAFGAIVIGQSGTQTGSITLEGADLSAANVNLTVNSNGTGGTVIFNTNGNPVAGLNAVNLGTGNLTVNAYTSITAAQIPGQGTTTATVSNDIVTTGIITLNTDISGGIQIGAAPAGVSAYPYASPAGYAPILIAAGASSIAVSGKNSTGVWLMGNGANLNVGSVSINGPLTTDIYNSSGSSGIIYLINDLNTGGQPAVYNGPVRLRPAATTAVSHAVTLKTGGGKVVFSSTLDEDDSGLVSAGTNSLIIDDVTGPVTFTGAVGGSKAFQNLTVNSASTIQVSSNLTTANSGNVALTHTGTLTLGSIAGYNISTSGTFGETGGGGVLMAANLTSTGTVSFSDSITLAANVQVSTGPATQTYTSSIAAGSGPWAFTSAGTGAKTFNGTVGTSAAPLASFASTGAGTLNLNSDLFTSGNISAGDTTVNLTSVSGTPTVSASAGSITFSNAWNVGKSYLISSGSPGTYSFGAGTVADGKTLTLSLYGTGTVASLSGTSSTGTSPLTLNGTGGTLTFTGATGAAVALGTLTVQNSGNVTFGGNVYCSNVVLSQTGTVTFTSTLQTTGDIHQTGAGTGTTNFNGAVTDATNLTLDAAGAMNLAAVNLSVTSAMSVSAGSFTQTGSNSSQTVGSLAVSGSGAVQWDSGLAGGSLVVNTTTSVTGGTLSFGKKSATFTGNFSATAGLTQFQSSNDTFNGTLAFTGSSSLNLVGASPSTSSLTLTGGGATSADFRSSNPITLGTGVSTLYLANPLNLYSNASSRLGNVVVTKAVSFTNGGLANNLNPAVYNLTVDSGGSVTWSSNNLVVANSLFIGPTAAASVTNSGAGSLIVGLDLTMANASSISIATSTSSSSVARNFTATGGSLTLGTGRFSVVGALAYSGSGTITQNNGPFDVWGNATLGAASNFTKSTGAAALFEFGDPVAGTASTTVLAVGSGTDLGKVTVYGKDTLTASGQTFYTDTTTVNGTVSYLVAGSTPTTVTYNTAVAPGNAGAQDYTVNGSLTVTSSNLIVGNVTVNLGGVLALNSSTTVNAALTLASGKTFTNSGTVILGTTYTGSTLTLSGTLPVPAVFTGTDLTKTGNFTIQRFSYNASTFTVPSGITATLGDANVTFVGVTNSGTLNASGNNFAMSGSWDNSAGTFANPATVTFTNSGVVTVTSGVAAAAAGVGPGKLFNSIVFAGTGASNDLQLAGPLAALGTVTKNTGAVLDLNAQTLLVQGTLNLNATSATEFLVGTSAATGSTVVLTGSAPQSIINTPGTSLWFYNLVVDAPGGVSPGNPVTVANRFVAFRGTWNGSGKNLTVGEDFVAYGPGYADYSLNGITYHPADDGEIANNGRSNTYYENKLGYPYWTNPSSVGPGQSGSTSASYIDLGSSAGISNLAATAFGASFGVWSAVSGTYLYASANYGNVTSSTHNGDATAAFTFNSGEVLTVGKNFYNFGAPMLSTGTTWTLKLPAKWTSVKLNAAKGTDWFGYPFAVALSTAAGMTVSHSTVPAVSGIVPTVAAAQTSVAGTYTAGTTTTSPAWTSAVTLTSDSGWDNSQPDIDTVTANLAATRFDNLVQVTFTKPIRNAGGEAAAAVGALSATAPVYVSNDRLLFMAGVTVAGSVWDFTAGTTGTAGEYSTIAATNADKNVISFRTLDGSSVPTWNTDATGSSVGSAVSTDRSGVSRNSTADLQIEKGRLYDSSGNPIVNHDGHNFNGAAGAGLSSRYTSTVGKARPVLLKILLGQAAKNFPPTTYEDGHNYWRLIWSAPVKIDGTSLLSAADKSALNSGAKGSIPSSTGALNPPAVLGFGDSYTSDGSNVQLTGLAQYAGHLYRSSHANYDASPQGNQVTALKSSNSLARSATGNDLFVYLTGYTPTLSGYTTTWDGFWWGDTASPAGTGFTVPPAFAAQVTDLAGNPVEDSNVVWTSPGASSDPKTAYKLANDTSATTSGIANSVNTVQAHTGWELDPPVFAPFMDNGATATYEVVPSENTAGTDKIDNIQFHILANRANSTQSWTNSAVQNPDTPDNTATNLNFGTLDYGVRDSSLSKFYQGVSMKLVSASTYTQLTSVATPNSTVNNSLFIGSVFTAPAGFSRPDSGYFSLLLNTFPVPANWTPVVPYLINYNGFAGMATNLAGRMVDSISGMETIDRTAPYIALTLTGNKMRTVYVQFSRKVTITSPTGDSSYKDVLKLTGSANAITSMTFLDGNASGVQQVLLHLANSFNPAEINTARLQANGTAAVVGNLNYMDATVTYPISFLGLNVVEPVWASDGSGGQANQTGTAHVITDFSGDALLTARDIQLQAKVWGGSAVTALPLRLYFDMKVPASDTVNSIWLPDAQTSFIAGIVPGIAETTARYSDSSNASTDGSLRNFLIPGTDPEMINGATVQFLFRLGSMDVVEASNPMNPLDLALWSFNLKGIKTQKNGVTILHNVINPNEGQQVQLNYTMSQAGMATVQVFALDGSLVRVLHRGRQAPGQYSLFWDGRNTSGSVVARGIYFIRVVVPDTDETRDLLVIK